MTRARRDWTALFLIGFGVAVLAALLIIAAVLLNAADKEKVDKPFEVSKALIAVAGSVAVTGVLGVLISSTLARRDDAREQREERARLASGALQDLKAGFEKGQVTRFMLRSNPTGGVLARQASNLLEARALLQRVQRAHSVADSAADEGAQMMLDVLSRLLEKEYAPHYYEFEDLRLSDIAPAPEDERSSARRRLDEDEFPNLFAFVAGDEWMEGYRVARDWLAARAGEA